MGLLALARAAVQFTGNAVRDFSDTTFDTTSGRTHNFGVLRVLDTQYDDNGLPILPVVPDVGVPNQFPRGTISGWDMRSIYFQYDDIKDTLMIGIDCFGICGDADGDGDAGRSSTTLMNIGGLDLPNLAQSESFVIALDLNLDVADVLPSFVPNLIVPFDYIIGVPGGQPANAEAAASQSALTSPTLGSNHFMGNDVVPYLQCSIGQTDNNLLGMQQCFGLYNYQLTAAVSLARRALSPATMANGSVWPATNYNPSNALDWPTAAQPNLEWTIGDISELRASKGAGFTRSNKEPWSLLIQAFSGSFQDAGVGEDYIPSETDYLNVQFPCLQLDACDVCLGDDSTCLDCAGVPNGPAVYDVCDVCAGDGSSCRDCMGRPNGAAVYDVCDVCNGNGARCRDCKGVPNGPAVYDQCDICGGDNSRCLDCAGKPNGATKYDVCDVCGGDGSTCRDCLGHANGAARYDVCDVCNGNGRSCLDCAGKPNGAAVYDVCDVCGGNGSRCLDCKGMPNGPAKYDACDVCGGNGSTCLDCAGKANGAARYDVCDVCNGNGRSCLDCSGHPNGAAVYDVCDVCGGNGTRCRDCLGQPNGPAVYDKCDVCNGDSSTCLDCAGKVNGATRYDVCDICGGNGSTCRDCLGVPNGPHRYELVCV